MRAPTADASYWDPTPEQKFCKAETTHTATIVYMSYELVTILISHVFVDYLRG